MENVSELEKVTAMVDSAAVDSVMASTQAEKLEIIPTEQSMNNMCCIAATGSKLAKLGKRALCGITANWVPVSMDIQVADVKHVLIPVRKWLVLVIGLF